MYEYLHTWITISLIEITFFFFTDLFGFLIKQKMLIANI